VRDFLAVCGGGVGWEGAEGEVAGVGVDGVEVEIV
jgi:hypothetical protein